MPPKIAFLFLTIENPNFTKIWSSYLRGHKDRFSIYLHPKQVEMVTWKKAHIIKNTKETKWGFITMAYMELFKQAFKDPDNYKFITISESCIPIQSFDNFYNAVMEDPRSWIKNMKINHYNFKERIMSQPHATSIKHFIKHYARFCLNREHTELLLKKEREMEFFHKMHVGDEFFLSVLHPLKNVRDFAVIYDDWDYIDKKRAELNKMIEMLYIEQEKKGTDNIFKIGEIKKYRDDISKNPKMIIDVEEDLDKIRGCNSFFYRKFSKTSNIEDYWKDIIAHHDK